MKRFIMMAALVFVGCQHAKQGVRPDEEARAPDSQQEKQPEAPKRAAAKPSAPKQTQTAPEANDRPQLSSKAEGLLQPEGAKLIQQALAEKGYLPREHQTNELDAETATALRRFQEDEHAPRTGYPDRETVRKLGLSVEKVFKSTGARDSSPDR